MANNAIKFKLSKMAEEHIKNPRTKGKVIKGSRIINLRSASQEDLSFLYGENGSAWVEIDLSSSKQPESPAAPGKK